MKTNNSKENKMNVKKFKRAREFRVSIGSDENYDLISSVKSVDALHYDGSLSRRISLNDCEVR